MLFSNTQFLELEVSNLLQKQTRFEEALSAVKTQHGDRLVAVCEFLFFIIQCEMFTENKTVFAAILLLKLAQEASLAGFTAELLALAKEHKMPLFKSAVFAFLNDVKLTQVLALDSEALRAYLEKISSARKPGEIDKKLATEAAQAPAFGVGPRRFSFYYDSNTPQFFDSPELFADTARSYHALSELLGESSEPDQLLPLPTLIDPTIDDLATPFPLFLEAPLLNPDFQQSDAAALLLRNMKKATDYEIDAH